MRLEAFHDAQPRAPGARIGSLLSVAGGDRLARNRTENEVWIWPRRRPFRPVDFRLAPRFEEILHDSIFERAKGDHGKASARCEARGDLREALGKHFEFAIHRDAQCLENAGRRMRTATAGNHGFDKLREREGGCNGLDHSRACDAGGDLTGGGFFTVLAKEPLKLSAAHGVYEVRSGYQSAPIHAHVEWSFVLETETTPGRVALVRGDAKIEQRAVCLLYTSPGPRDS